MTAIRGVRPGSENLHPMINTASVVQSHPILVELLRFDGRDLHELAEMREAVPRYEGVGRWA